MPCGAGEYLENGDPLPKATVEACRQADWYDLGFRDAIFGIQPQDAVYASQCQPSGAKVDVARYAQGWREGRYEADARTPGSVD